MHSDWKEDRKHSSGWIYVCLDRESEISALNFSCSPHSLSKFMCLLIWSDSTVLDSNTCQWSVSSRARHPTCYEPEYKNTPSWQCNEPLISWHVSLCCESRWDQVDRCMLSRQLCVYVCARACLCVGSHQMKNHISFLKYHLLHLYIPNCLFVLSGQSALG